MSCTFRKFNEKYFEILEDYFSAHYEEMKKRRQTFDVAAQESLKAYTPVLAASIVDTLNEELSRLDWDGVESAITRQGGVKAVLEAPVNYVSYAERIQRMALYADTVILSNPAPWHDVSGDFSRWQESTRLYYVIANALGDLQLKELLLADLTPPIAVLVRPLAFIDSENLKAHFGRTNDDAVALSSEIFDVHFSSVEELQTFVRNHKTLDNLCKNMKKPELLTGGITNRKYSLKDEIKSYMNTMYKAKPYCFTGLEDPQLLVEGVGEITTKLSITNSQLFSTGRLGAQALADDNHRWVYLAWKFKHDSELLAEKSGSTGVPKDSLVLNALQLDEFSWLGNVPIEGIVKLRQDGELQNLRETLGRGIERIQSVSDDDFVAVTRQVGYNLEQEFRRHEAQVRSMDEDFRRKCNFNLASLAVGGTIAVMSTMFPPLATLAAFVGPIGATKTMYDILQERTKRSELRRKPIALLFEAYEKRNAQNPAIQS